MKIENNHILITLFTRWAVSESRFSSRYLRANQNKSHFFGLLFSFSNDNLLIRSWWRKDKEKNQKNHIFTTVSCEHMHSTHLIYGKFIERKWREKLEAKQTTKKQRLHTMLAHSLSQSAAFITNRPDVKHNIALSSHWNAFYLELAWFY